MSLFSSIGSFVSKAISTVKSAYASITKFFNTPLSETLAKYKEPLEKIAGNLPFGIGKVAKPWIDKNFDKAVAWLQKGPMATLASILGVSKSTDEVADTAEYASTAAQKAGGITQDGAHNMAHITAAAHANLVA